MKMLQVAHYSRLSYNVSTIMNHLQHITNKRFNCTIIDCFWCCKLHYIGRNDRNMLSYCYIVSPIIIDLGHLQHNALSSLYFLTQFYLFVQQNLVLMKQYIFDEKYNRLFKCSHQIFVRHSSRLPYWTTIIAGQ